MKQIIFIFCLATIMLQAKGQFCQFTGMVKSQNGEPLAGSSVYFENTVHGTVTNSKGEFVFTHLAEGKYILIISYVGYETYKEEIDLKTDLERSYILYPGFVLGEEVIVRAVRAGRNDPFACTNVSSEDLSRQNTGKDMPALLLTAPSVVSTSDAGTGIGYSGFRIRGTDAGRINVTVNGVPLNDSESHGVWWVNMPDFASSVKNLQIQRGVGTSSNGAAAFGASINIQTHSLNDKPYAEISQSFGSFNTRKSTLSAGTGLVNESLAFDARLSKISSDGYIDRASADLSSYYLSAGLFKPHTTIKLITFSGKEKTYQAWDGVPGDMIAINRTYNGNGKYTTENGEIKFYDNETDNYNQHHIQLHFLREFSSNLYMNAVIFYTRGLGYYEQYKENRKLAEYLIPDISIGQETIKRSDLIRRKWLDNHFYGTNFSLIYKDNKYENILGGGYNYYHGDHYGEVIWARFAGNTEINHRWYENNGIKQDFNVFNKINYNLKDDLSIYADLQIRGISYNIKGPDDDLEDISQKHNYLLWDPKFGLNYEISDRNRVYFSFATAHREPTRTDLKDAKKGRPAPVPEVLFDYETGYALTKANWALDVNIFYMDYYNQLVMTGEINNTGNPVMRNVKDSYRAGIEMVSSLKPLKNLQWDANITVSRNRIKNIVIYVDNQDYYSGQENQPFQYAFPLTASQISFSPSVVAASSIKYNLSEKILVDLNSKYVSKQYIDMSGSEARKLDPYLVSNLNLNYSLKIKFLKEFNLSFLIANIFNKKYISNAWVYRYFEDNKEKRSDGFFPQAGIHLLAGLNIKF